MHFIFFLLLAQSDLQQQIKAISADAKGKVSVACAPINCDFNPHAHPPMQSVFKMPLALAVLHQVDQGKFTLDQPIRFLPGDRILPKTHSPLQDKYPAANADIPLRDILRLTVSESDNAGSEILLRIIGGTKVVQDFGIKGFQLLDSEQVLHRDPKAQYRNWWEPSGAVEFLLGLKDPRLLGWMRETSAGPKRIKGLLPPGTIVWHKTGTSSKATNDIGVIELPNGKHFAIAIFVTDAKADVATQESVIARIAKAAYDAAVGSKLTQ